MLWNQDKLKFLLPIGGTVLLAGIAGYLVLRIYKKDDKESEENEEKLQSYITQRSSAEIRVPRNAVGAVIGRQGTNIKFIQDKTLTTINFKEDDDIEKERICIIRGKIDKIEEAKKLILQAVEETPVLEQLEMKVPNYVFGKIIGSNGETANYVSRITGAVVKGIEKKENSEGPFRHIMISGTQDQIRAAELAIIEKIEKEEALRDQIQKSAANISQRTKVKHEENGHIPNVQERTVLKKDDEPVSDNESFLEGIVSAVDNPSHFWFQIKGPDIIKLNKLVEEMTGYYNEEANRELHHSEKFKMGDIVAARFPHDNNWYRGSVCKHEKGDDPSMYIVYFVDFGDTDEVAPVNICELRTDYLQLKFQAVEANLAGIDPKSLSPEAVEIFSSLVYVNLYDSVKVKIVGYSQEDGGPGLPYVQLINADSGEDTDVAEELIRRGVAKRKR